MTNDKIVENIFKGLATIIMSICLYFLKDFGNSLDNMQMSVNKLNISFATMGERLVNQGFRYDLLEKRIEIMENKMDMRTKDRWTKLDHMRYDELIREQIADIKQDIKECKLKQKGISYGK